MLHLDSMVTLCPHRAKIKTGTSSEFIQPLSVTTITEAVVRYLELRLITTAGQYTYANTYTDRVASLLRLFPF